MPRRNPRRTRIIIAAVTSGFLIIAGVLVYPALRFRVLRSRYESAEPGPGKELALRRILRLETPESVPLLLEVMEDGDARERHLDALLDLIDEGHLPLLLERLRGATPESRSVAAFLLATLLDEPYVTASGDVRQSLPAIASGLIEGMAAGAEAQDLAYALRDLGTRFPDLDVTLPLLGALRSPRDQGQWNGLRAIFFLDTALLLEDEGIHSEVRSALGSEVSKVRLAAALVLEKSPAPEDREVLIQASRDSHDGIREVACSALGSLGGEDVTEALLERLDDEEPGVREAAALSLGRLGVDSIVPHLVGMLREFRTMEIEGATGTRVKVSNPFPAEAAAHALASFDTEEAIGALSDAATDRNLHDRVRIRAMRSLGELGSPEGVPALERVVQEMEWEIRLEAILALKRIGDGRAREVLVAELRRAVAREAPRGEIEALGGALREITGKTYGPYAGDDRRTGEAGVHLWEAYLRGEDQ